MHYHLIGIAGTAMASLAGLLRAKGHEVTGSDEGVYPPMSDMLHELGIDPRSRGLVRVTDAPRRHAVHVDPSERLARRNDQLR